MGHGRLQVTKHQDRVIRKDKSMDRLLGDSEVAELLGISVKALHKRRDKERGGIYNGQRLDLLPSWVEVPGRTRAQGTPLSEVEAWI